MRRLIVLVLLASVLAAGCFGGDDAPVEAASAEGGAVTIDEDRPEPTFNNIPNADLGFVALPDTNATLLEPPQLIEGEWWRIEFTDKLTGAVTEFVRVVARVEDDVYVFGMPHEGWWKEAVIFHAPGFGDVNKDLSHRAHDVPFQPLVFPLEDGATWETAWENPDPVTATVAVETPTTARVTFTGTNCGLFGLVGQCPNPQPGVIAEVVYDATLHEISEADFPSHTWRVLDHGTGYQGWITVPRGEHLAFLHGRLGASTFDFVNGVPATPFDTVNLAGGYNRVSFVMAAGSIVGAPAGAYSEKATAPDGTVYELSQIPGNALTIAFFEHPNPDGDWQFEHLVAGPGLVLVEGIAYHQYDIHLPSRNVRADHSHEVVR